MAVFLRRVVIFLLFASVFGQEIDDESELPVECPRSWETNPYACTKEGYERLCEDHQSCPAPLLCCSVPSTCQVRCTHPDFLVQTDQAEDVPPTIPKPGCPLPPERYLSKCTGENMDEEDIKYCHAHKQEHFVRKVCKDDDDCRPGNYACCPDYRLQEYRCLLV